VSACIPHAGSADSGRCDREEIAARHLPHRGALQCNLRVSAGHDHDRNYRWCSLRLSVTMSELHQRVQQIQRQQHDAGPTAQTQGTGRRSTCQGHHGAQRQDLFVKRPRPVSHVIDAMPAMNSIQTSVELVMIDVGIVEAGAFIHKPHLKWPRRRADICDSCSRAQTLIQGRGAAVRTSTASR